MTDAALPIDAVAEFLHRVGGTLVGEPEALRGGGNNRVYRLLGTDGPLLLKVYFRHPDDPRDRLGTEFAFASFAWSCGIRALARPIARDDERGWGLFEFLQGEPIRPNEVTSAEIAQAVAFFQALNAARTHPDAGSLPKGSEACFTIDEHIACVERRIRRLANLEGGSPSAEEARVLVQEQMLPTWNRIRTRLSEELKTIGLDAAEPIDSADRCLSPSDFGFHNALRLADGSLRFFDFEYAGWDDPAKTACDFLCQPAVPIPSEFAATCVTAFTADFPGSPAIAQRTKLLLPLYRLKWGCIMLNDFLPAGNRRRAFARPSASEDERRTEQLAKVRRVLAPLAEV